MKVEDFNLALAEDQAPWRLFTPDGSTQGYCVLWLQGWSSSMDSHREGVERMSTNTNIPFATLDYAGHGRHAVKLEDSTRHQQHNEVVAIFDEIKKRGFEKIIVIGGSFGGYMAALLSGVRPVHAVVLRAPAMYADTEFDTRHAETAKWKNPDRDQHDRATDAYINDNEAVRAIRKFEGFTYVLEHELDEQVPRVMPRTYFDNAKHGNYFIIPKTKHSPKLMDNPQPHFAYIEHVVISIIEATKLQANLEG